MATKDGSILPGGTVRLPSTTRINLEEPVRVASPSRINLEEPIRACPQASIVRPCSKAAIFNYIVRLNW